MAKVWYKYKNFWRRGDNDGDNTPQDRDDGTGDLLWNTLTKIVKDEDTSSWAFDSFLSCGDLLVDKKRWPDKFNKGDEAPNRWIYYFYKYLGIKKYGYRSQDDMTRDPYKAFAACYAHLIKAGTKFCDKLLEDAFLAVKPPWYLLHSRHTWRWWKRFKKDNKPHYVKRMTYFEALAIVNWFEKNYEDDFYKDRTE